MSRTDPKLVAPCGEKMKSKVWSVAAKNGKAVDPVAQRYVLEAALRRIFQSEHADEFGLEASLKGGALMYLAEGVDAINGRGTKDIDLQITDFAGTMDDLKAIMQQVLAEVPAIDDGVRFDVDAIEVKAREGGVPGGSVSCWTQIAGTRVRFKADVGFYDANLKDTLIAVDYPSMIDALPSIRIWRQRVEYAISDKCHAAWKHGDINSRLRDYYDLFVFFTKCHIDEAVLEQAFRRSWPMYDSEISSSVDEIDGYSMAWAAKQARDFAKVRAAARWAVPTPELPEIVHLIR